MMSPAGMSADAAQPVNPAEQNRFRADLRARMGCIKGVNKKTKKKGSKKKGFQALVFPQTRYLERS